MADREIVEVVSVERSETTGPPGRASGAPQLEQNLLSSEFC